ncbi:MAG TPA: sigma-54-dependent Fis family transcriptional regulator [Desulfonatronum sp.]|nr:sigma-54-dependent Fis family transcriptional regulator [Desulfonatronum sp.]
MTHSAAYQEGPALLRVAVVDDEPLVLKNLSKSLGKRGYAVEVFADGKAFIKRMEKVMFAVVLSDIRMPGMDGMELLAAAKSLHPDIEVILLTGYGTIDSAVRAIKQGAFSYIEKPVTPERVLAIVRQALEKQRLSEESRLMRDDLIKQDHLREILGASPATKELIRVISKVAQIDCNVLIQGESGTGKELTARAIHYGSRRKQNPFVAFNCGSFTEELVANELFGHERGAFTGADSVKVGLLEAGQGGTVFLDEISEMPLSMQVKLLRTLQERKVYRVGGSVPIDLDIRVIAATNKDLEHEAKAGNFREDLYYRLKVIMVRTPPLRERRGDILMLGEHFLKRFNLMYGKDVQGMTKNAQAVLQKYPFPGNVRELEHIICSAVALCDGKWIDTRDFPEDLEQLETRYPGGNELPTLAEQEAAHLRRVLEATNFNKIKAAQILDVPRTTLWRMIKRHNIKPIK